MATNTTNYKLKKPATTDYVTIGDINDNMDKIDAQMHSNALAIAKKIDIKDLATVATSGSYNDLANKPTIPKIPSVATQSANGLMSSADKKKLDGIETGANKTTVDTALSNTSTNPVQNKVINSALANKAGTSVATTSANGLMSSTDKSKLDGIATGAQVNTITGVKGNSESAYRTGNVNITKANIGLGNVDNTSDANKPISTAVQTALNGKQATMSAGTGISLNGTTINHSNSVTAATTAIGSKTKVPCIKYDAQGHITSCTTATIYPPTSAGTSGQIWQSDGSGTGVWQTLDTTPKSGSGNAITSGGVYNAINYTRHFTYVAGATNVSVSGKTVSFYGVNFTYIRTGPKCGVLSGMYRVGSGKGTYSGFAYIDLAWLGKKFGVSFKKPSSSYYSGTWYYPDGGSSMYDKVQYCHVLTDNSGAICIGRIYSTSSFGDWNWTDHDNGNWISIEGVFLEEA